jgi:hypothetical protein
MPDEKPKKVRRSRELTGSRVEPTSSTGIETPASSRPKKKKMDLF